MNTAAEAESAVTEVGAVAETVVPPAKAGERVMPRFRRMQDVKEEDRSRYAYRFFKRLFDIVFSAVVIVVLFIPSLILCAIIRAESKGNPIYIQTRVGRVHRDGSMNEFSMYKFRSMRDGADDELAELMEKNEVSGAMFKMKNDPRVTKVGKFIRKHSIDEMPQFLNVFLGQMSVVGPRPPLPREVAQYSERDLERLAVKPGLTGPWQVTGRNDVGFEDMVNMDLEYIENRGALLDVKYILKTIKVVLTGGGAY